MSFSVRPDKFSKSQARERRARAADSMRLPPAPQLPKVRVGELPSRGSRLFVGDIRRSQLRPSVPQIANDTAMHESDRVRASLAKRLSKTAVVVCFIVIAIGGLSLVLFPNAPREAVPSHTRSILATSAPQGATVSRREKHSPAKSTSHVGVPHPRLVEAGSTTTSSTKASKTLANIPIVPTATAGTQIAKTMNVAASANSAHQPQTQPQQQEQLDHQQLRQRQVQQHDERILTPEEVDRLTKWGQEFLARGDLATARRFLERAAQARDVRATLLLGTTYDPDALRKMGAVGIQPDLQQALSWYTRAAELGSREASQRLTALAQLAR